MSRYAMCPECGHRLTKISSDEYYCKYCVSDSYDEDDEEDCESWCGNPAYPNCKASCSMYDD